MTDASAEVYVEMWAEYKAVYGRLPSRGIREYLENPGMAQAYRRAGVQALHVQVQKLQKLKDEEPRAAGARRPRMAGEVGPDLGRDALSRIQAMEAGRMDEVQGFRHRVLNDEIMSHEAAVEWIEDEAQRHRPTIWATFPLEDAPSFAAAAGALQQAGGVETHFEARLLKYLKPGERISYTAAVNVDSPLHELRSVSRALSVRYGWHEAAATVFVLTDVLPPIPRGSWKLHFDPSVPGGTRITLTISPQMTEKEVAHLYSMARSPLISDGRGTVGARYPAVTNARTTRLALFGAEANLDGLTWPEAMQEWNRRHPDYKVAAVGNFARDVRSAYKRVTGTRLDWQGVTSSERDS